jgi:hypothetical protein
VGSILAIFTNGMWGNPDKTSWQVKNNFFTNSLLAQHSASLWSFKKIPKTLHPREAVGSILDIFTHGMWLNPDKTPWQAKNIIFTFQVTPSLSISLVFPK